MSFRALAGGVLRWFRGDGPGTLYYLDPNEEEAALLIPADYASVRYVLSVNQSTGLPYWVAVTDLTFSDGFGVSFGTGFGTS